MKTSSVSSLALFFIGVSSAAMAQSSSATSVIDARLVHITDAIRAQGFCPQAPIIDGITFDLIVEDLRSEGASSAYSQTVIAQMLEAHLVTVGQLRRVLALLTRTDERLALVQAASKRLADPAQAGDLYSLFTQRTERRALARILAGL